MEIGYIGYFIVFFARVADVSLTTIRTLMLMRGKKLAAATIGFFEVLIYIIALKYIFNTLNDVTSLIFYAFGFSTGNIVGLWLEEKLAVGHLTMRVITRRNAGDFAEKLRQEGFGVTLFPCQGREGCYDLLEIALERKRLKKLEKMVHEWDGDAFVTVSDTRNIRGGHFYNMKSK
ncbi:hypothetical protein SDC9_138787 [bioreactor metagenome]|uniref:Uncharacterized protein n=1 Tax=bioreactor metagenome TaxID=1076179 RepID=A0A645DQS1_9ZZZZ